MNYNWPIIGDKIFGILKGSGHSVQMFDKQGKKTLDPHEATRFFATIKAHDPDLKSYGILVSVHDENRYSHVDIKTPNLKDDRDFRDVEKLKNNLKVNLGDREGLSVNWLKFDHVIRPKDDVFNNITESKDISRPFGSTKSSYQWVGEAKLIIRHTDIVNEEKKGSRWRQIKTIFIENREGERFKFPHRHIAGARAMARHISNNGTMHDEIGEAIQQLSSDYTDLKNAARMIRGRGDESRTSILREVLNNINKQVKSLSGPRGYSNTSSTLTEKKQVNDTDVNTIYSDLLETCQCDHSDENSRYLMVAARYFAESKDLLVDSEKILEFSRKPDLVSRVSEFTDQKQRLAWQIEEMADCVNNNSVKQRLIEIAKMLKENRAVAPAELDLVREVYLASKGQSQEAIVEESSILDRIKELSGI